MSHHLATSSPTTSNNTTTTLQHDNDTTTDEGGAQEGRMTMVGGGLSCPSPKTGSYFKLFNLYFTLLIHNKMTPSVARFEWRESFVPNNTPPPNVCSPPSCALQCVPNMKTHPQWCVFVFG